MKDPQDSATRRPIPGKMQHYQRDRDFIGGVKPRACCASRPPDPGIVQQ
jgi:hypothetical protein